MTRLTVAALLACAACIAQAHEVRPAYLKLNEIEPSVFAVLWKQPVLGDRRLPIDAELPPACERTETAPPEVTNGALLERWTVRCGLREGRIVIRGLPRTLTDVMVQVDYLDGKQASALLRAGAPELDLADPTPSVWSYLSLGVQHLLLGIDHILFVVGLVLFIRNGWLLVKTVTAFTVAHSVTLAASVLNVVSVPQAPVEAVIALSILFLARELVMPANARSAITLARPWLMAFAFGLLHGFGFAGALTEIGLPTDQLAPALLLFNVGIELGQLAVIAVMLAAGAAFRALPDKWISLGSKGFASAMGVAAAFWTIDRVALVF